MAAEEEEKQEGVPGKEKKSYWWLTLSLLLFFLAGSGYLFLASTRTASQKMAGRENLGPDAAEDLNQGGSNARKGDVFFASEEPSASSRPQAAGSALNEKLKPGWVKEMAAAGAPAAAGQAGGAMQAAAGQAEEQVNGGAGDAPRPQAGLTMAARLQTKGFSGGAGGAAGARTAAAAGPAAAFQGNGASIGKPSVQRQTAAASPQKGARGSVMDALKGSFRASLYGARVASQDSAKSWIAKAFDATPDYDTAIQYDDEMRAKLDKVNPNAIPHFLREQDISASEAKTLQASDVGQPILDKDAEEGALKADKEFQKRTAGASLSGSMINMLFAGIDGGAGASGTSPAAGPVSRGVTDPGADPNADPSLTGTDDPYASVPQGGGLNYIFGANGNILGCEDSSAGMCLMPGADGCPSGLSMDSGAGSSADLSLVGL